jgi:hypothetical protein
MRWLGMELINREERERCKYKVKDFRDSPPLSLSFEKEIGTETEIKRKRGREGERGREKERERKLSCSMVVKSYFICSIN